MKKLVGIGALSWPLDSRELKTNLLAGFIIFLIALPLSIGISVASGAPPSAGILAAIIGGVVGSLVSGSYVTISGPAAGLIVVVLDAISALGGGDPVLGFRITLAAIVFAGLLQILIGYFKLGGMALAVPVNALQGMLTSIGLIIMIKQVFVIEGISPHAKSILLQLIEIPQRVSENNLEIFLIGISCLAIVILFNRCPRLNRILPAPLAAVALGLAYSFIVDIAHPHRVELINRYYEVGPNFLLKVPENFKDFFIYPLFAHVLSSEFFLAVLTIALVGSIESVLSTAAVDKLDPMHRESDLNMDLVSKGICNTILGFIGGIPVISEIVRSSANISNGATNRWSNLFHGLFIAGFVLFASSVLNQIPLATFAAILIYVGFKLVNPLQFKNIFRMGWDQFLVFLGTILLTLATDLLIGILFGTLLNFIFNAVQSKSFIKLIKLDRKVSSTGDLCIIDVKSACVFSNMLTLKKIIDKSDAKNIIVNFAGGTFVDVSARLLLQSLQNRIRNEHRFLDLNGLSLMHVKAGH